MSKPRKPAPARQEPPEKKPSHRGWPYSYPPPLAEFTAVWEAISQINLAQAKFEIRLARLEGMAR